MSNIEAAALSSLFTLLLIGACAEYGLTFKMIFRFCKWIYQKLKIALIMTLKAILTVLGYKKTKQ